MPRNIELKARAEDLEALAEQVAEIADLDPTEIHQDDTFFRCASGRLKLRTFSPTEGELIYYQRSDQEGPKESTYVIHPTRAPDSLRETLSLAYGQCGRVRKHRTLFLLGRTRIHLDRVAGLGNFLELEVVLEEGGCAEAGVKIAEDLRVRLGITAEQLVSGAYVDLLDADGYGCR
jgi:predicted adenylyl cyclase CyaB